MTSKPLIAIPGVYRSHKKRRADYGISDSYVNAVLAGGGLPLVLPSSISTADWPALLARFDGFLFAGGGDIEPQRYGGPIPPDSYGFSKERDDFELGLLEGILEADKPLLAICRGCQVLNVGLGGSLIGDIRSQCPEAGRHDWYPDIPRDKLAHSVKVEAHSLLAACIGGGSHKINSLHHQSILKLGKKLRVNAQAPDGIIEGIELPGKRFILGVQWHPEELFEQQKPMLALFQALVQACQQP